jgi:hypothetical protein
MSELILLIAEAPDGGFTARALGESIFTEADGPRTCTTRSEMPSAATATRADFPGSIRLRVVREEVPSD